ncbi:MAG: glycosyltransferase family 4 protein [Bacteroidales bacterium]|jgi:glycosyltransferase involved in cell wall biosynthesis|nr:glycosyltransferase family 4 protein [Bacteroidales bacterium]
MSKVLVVATSRKTRGGITSVIKAHETGAQWKKYHCVWIQTHRDGPAWIKLLYLATAYIQFLLLLPFADIVHFHCAGRTSAKRKTIMAKIARCCGKIVLVHFHPPGPHDVFDPESHYIVKRLFDIANKIVVLSPQWVRWINEAYQDRQYPMEILWNPVPVVKRDALLRQKQILYAGKVIKRKGYDTLLYGWSEIASEFPDWKVVFAGNGEIEEGKRIVKELGIESQVEWLGWISGTTKETVFNQSSIYCLASSGEGFPMGVLDAWAYGIPCVVTPVGGIPDIVKDGLNGLIFPVGDKKTLAEQLRRLLSCEKLRSSIVQESDKLVNGEFSVNAVTRHLEHIYENLLNKKE